MKQEITVIFWDDASASVGWEVGKEFPPLECVTAGKVIAENDRMIMLAGTWGENDEDHNCRITIPAGWIKKRKVIKV